MDLDALFVVVVILILICKEVDLEVSDIPVD